MAQRKALITGITGQDAAYLAKYLLDHGYHVVGTFRRTASSNMWRLEELGILDRVEMLPMDLLELTNIVRVVQRVQPSEIYNLAAQSFVGVSFEQSVYTSQVNAIGVCYLLEAIRTVDSGIRFYQASTSEMFGKVRAMPQNENTPFYPRSPYAVAKVYAHYMTINYREAHGLHATCGILFNHESPLRGREFVTRKITASLAKIRHGQQDVLELGNLDAYRDWGFAGDYVRGMHLMLQQPHGDDYVLATGEMHSVREFCEKAAQCAGFDLQWEGEGAQTRGRDRRTGKTVIRVNPAYYRPAEVDRLCGDASKAKRVLGWRPEMTFDQLVEHMMRADLERAARGVLQALRF
ncbi:GDP-mannose 4,6-dehydratase [Desulfosoma caldarium]|uniref:GDP-mannose 4,6-dehydratase n=1 Tax=Desulfosoma caldarium TaxID=610254 RepID=A0A3N1VTM5_9BACT|nr:GDP-mannose 4,6-dehydratase [Desulfosoma caldarium]ROR03147.1 GDPmannose 4,6-dehydratase [Desulfosoma caldarium]